MHIAARRAVIAAAIAFASLAAAAPPTLRHELQPRSIGKVLPTDAVAKIKELKKAGYLSTPDQLGASFKLDMVTPYIAGRGYLSTVYIGGGTWHIPGGFASIKTRRRITDEGPPFDITPGVLLTLDADTTHHQLIDCYVTAAQMEFQIAPTASWWDAPLSTATTTAASGHVYFVLPKTTAGPYRYVRLRAGAQEATDTYWRFVGCEVTPVVATAISKPLAPGVFSRPKSPASQ
jgi:hypothetical protein